MAELTSTSRDNARKATAATPSAGAHTSESPEGPEPGVGAPEEGLVARHAALMADPRLGSSTSGQRMRTVQRLQRGYGNAYVAGLVQRAVATAAPPVAGPVDPHQDPHFIAVEHKVGQTAKQEKKHPPAKAKAAEAQAAAKGPPNDVASQAAEKQVDKMDQQKPGEFDKKAFIAAVKKAIEASAPKNLQEADDFKSSGKAGQVKGEVSGLVGKDKEKSEGPLKKANTEAPDTSAAKPKEVKPMADEKPGAAPGDAGAAQAIPSPKSAAETSMAAGPAAVNQEMAQSNVTEEQLKNSNEPQFTDAAEAKKGAEANSQAGPAEYKGIESQVLGKAGADAKGAAGSALQGMHGERAGALGAVGGQKGGTKSKDEAKRAEVSSKIETIFNQTRTEVTTILDGLDAKVTTEFDTGEKAARDKFESFVEQKMKAYKDDRYDGIIGAGRWIKDKFMGMPSEVNAFYTDGRNLYLQQMEAVISRVADVVGGELGKAKARIALGKQQVKEFVASQPKELQQVAKDAEQQIGSKFEQLESDVNSKQDGLVQSLAEKYVSARDALDSRISDLKAANKGFVDKALDAIGGVIKTIMQLKDMLLGVLAKAAGVIGEIIKDPIKFLGNLVSAIKMGLNQFVGKIGTHLKKALMGWLFGTLGDAGITLPDSLDLKGIISLILQVLGLTYENVRAIAVKIAGEKVVAFVEGTVKFFTTLVKEGPAGLWQWIKDKIADLNIKDMVIGAIKDFVITKIITAGITWLISMLNPAAAFIKACKMIYDVIMFFIERGSQIMEFVNSVLDGIGAIAAGSLGAAANLVENSLAKILPLAISFLASLLGVGGIAEKIKEIIEKIRAPIFKLVTAIVGPILKPLKKLYDKGAKFVKGAIDKGKALGKKAIAKVKGKLYGGKDEDKQKRLAAGLQAGKAAVDKYSGKSVGKAVLTPLLAALRLRHRLTVLRPVQQGEFWAVEGDIMRATKVLTGARAGSAAATSGDQDRDGVTRTDIEGRFRHRLPSKDETYVFALANKIWIIRRGPGQAEAKERFHLISNGPGSYSLNEGPPPDAEHEEFKPRVLDVQYDLAAGERIVTFKYDSDAGKGLSFEVRQRLVDQMTSASSGKHLTLKPVQGRGKTDETASHEANRNLHNSHLIADVFGGCGYKQSLNLISTSAEFNLNEMGRVERAIGVAFVAAAADRMDIDIAVEWGNLGRAKAKTDLDDKIAARVIAEAKAAQKQTRTERVRAFLAEMAAKTDVPLKRCLQVSYSVTFKDGRAKVGSFADVTKSDRWIK